MSQRVLFVGEYRKHLVSSRQYFVPFTYVGILDDLTIGATKHPYTETVTGKALSPMLHELIKERSGILWIVDAELKEPEKLEGILGHAHARYGLDHILYGDSKLN